MPLVLTHQKMPSYDDLPELRYHFPKTYLNTMKDGVGDWFVYYEPRRQAAGSEAPGGRQCYFATGRISHVAPDPAKPDHFYAFVTDYLEFDSEVPFRVGDQFLEHGLRKEDGSANKGRFGRSVRAISSGEYEQILALGFKDGKPLLRPEVALSIEDPVLADRPIVEKVRRAVFRDYKFCQHVQEAYSSRCAMTGLSMIDRRGFIEVEAAHIRPAGGGHNGPDSVRNGLALTRTIHWLFDHGFLFVEDDNTITQRSGIPEKVTALLNPDRKLLIPEDMSQRPHPSFLRYHREVLFKL